MENCIECMLKKSAFPRWVKELAVDNLVIFWQIVEKNGLLIQSDSRATGQEVVIVTTFNPETTTEDFPFVTPIQFLLGTQSACGKSGKHEAGAILKGLNTLAASNPFKFHLLSLGRDSSKGTVETILLVFEQGADCFDDTSKTDASPESCGC
jgi:hypothetical protein